MSKPIKYTKSKVVKLTEIQYNTLKKLETYKSFLESQEDYSIFYFYDYLRNNHWSNTDISTLERWTDHFVGDGWWQKIKSHVDRIFRVLSEVDLKHINDAMLEIYDTLPDEKESKQVDYSETIKILANRFIWLIGILFVLYLIFSFIKNKTPLI